MILHRKNIIHTLTVFCFVLLLNFGTFAQNSYDEKDENDVKKAEAILQKAIKKLGGEKYLNIKSQIGRGKFSTLRDGRLSTFQTFVDVIVYFDKERTEFKGGGVKNIQTNYGDSGWIYDSGAEIIKIQDEDQIKYFKQGIRTSLDYLLRGDWKSEGAVLEYGGMRPASLGKRNEVVKLFYKDGFTVEHEFAADDFLPMKSLYKRTNVDGEEIVEENRYAQFITVQGVYTPFIIDHFTGDNHVSRINYEEVEYNKTIPNSVFSKPDNPKKVKDLKF